MPTGNSPLSLQQLRGMVAARVEARGLRKVARELMLDPHSVRNFLAGSTPRETTRQRMQVWYIEQLAGEISVVTPEAAQIALDMLLLGLRPSERRAVMPEVVVAFRDIYERHMLGQPEWLTELRAKWRK